MWVLTRLPSSADPAPQHPSFHLWDNGGRFKEASFAESNKVMNVGCVAKCSEQLHTLHTPGSSSLSLSKPQLDSPKRDPEKHASHTSVLLFLCSPWWWTQAHLLWLSFWFTSLVYWEGNSGDSRTGAGLQSQVARNAATKRHRGLTPFSHAKGTAHYIQGWPQTSIFLEGVNLSRAGERFLTGLFLLSRRCDVSTCLRGLSPLFSVTVYIIYVHLGSVVANFVGQLYWVEDFLETRWSTVLGVSVKVFQENSLWVRDWNTKICPQHRQM